MVYFVVANACATGGTTLSIEAVEDGFIPPHALMARDDEQEAAMDLCKIAERAGSKAQPVQAESSHCIGLAIKRGRL